MSGARCDACHGEGTIDRLASPDEVDAGCELGIAFDPCPDCDGSGRVEPDTLLGVVDNPVPHNNFIVPIDTLLGVVEPDDYDAQAETGQGATG